MSTGGHRAARLAIAFVAACGTDDVSAPTHRLGGSVTGLWTGGAITLRLASESSVEDLVVGADESFTFERRLPEGASYTVTVVDDGPDHDCEVANGAGTVAAADVADLAVRCTDLIPLSLTLSVPVSFGFDSRVTHYELATSILQQKVAVTVIGAALTGARVGDAPVVIGQPSEPVPLAPGQTTVMVEVARGPLTRRYELVFDRGAIPITEAFRLFALDNEGIGRQVAADGDWLAVSAPFAAAATQPGGPVFDGAGTVLMYRRTGATWAHAQTLSGSAGSDGRLFGWSVDIDGDALVVGARAEDGLARDAGAAYVFRLDEATGQWHEEQRLAAPDARASDHFGSAVAMSGDVVAVSAPLHDHESSIGNRGQVYVFRKAGGSWAQPPTVLRSQAPFVDQRFGSELALAGDYLIAEAGGGTAAAHRWNGTAWTPESLTPVPWVSSMTVVGGVLVIGSTQDGNGGAIHFYDRGPDGWTRTTTVVPTVPISGAAIGLGVALRGDVLATTKGRSLQVFHRAGDAWIEQPAYLPLSGVDGVGPAVAVGANEVFSGNGDDQAFWIFR